MEKAKSEKDHLKAFAIVDGNDVSLFSRFDFYDGVEERIRSAYLCVRNCSPEYLKEQSIPAFDTEAASIPSAS